MKKAFWIMAMLLIASIGVNIWLMSRKPDVETKIERDTIWKDTTIYTPSPVDSNLTGRVVYIKVKLPGDTMTIRDTVRDSIEVPIPIMQKRYDDSLYTAWVSGFQPNLDSIQLHQPEITNTVTKYVTKPAKRLAFGPSLGLGYGFINGKPDIYIGATVTWNFNK